MIITKQAKVDDIVKLHDYLDYRKSYEGKLYHYTNIGSLIRIIKSGKLLLNNIKNVNDAMEASIITENNMYVASFTYESKEAVHYWAVYGRNDPYSIRISVDNQSISKDPHEFQDKNDNPVEISSLIFSDVIYYNKRNPLDKNKRCWKHNGLYFSIANNEESIRSEFPGRCKYDIWEHEKEARLLVETKYEGNNIFLKLPDSFFESMSVTFSPWIDNDIREEFGKMILLLLMEKRQVKKNMSLMRESSIHNQIRLK